MPLHPSRVALAVACSHQVTTAIGTYRVDVLAADLPATAWQRVSAGPGARLPLLRLVLHRSATRRRRTRRTPLAADPPQPPDRRTGLLPLLVTQPVALRVLVAAAGRRWKIEESFQTRRPESALTNTNTAAGPPGTAGPPSRASPTPSSPPDLRPPPPLPPGGSGPADRQRTTPPVPHPDHRTHPPTLRPALLVHPPTPPSSQSQDQPLPPTSPHRAIITIPGWSTKWRQRVPLMDPEATTAAGSREIWAAARPRGPGCSAPATRCASPRSNGPSSGHGRKSSRRPHRPQSLGTATFSRSALA